MQIPTEIISVGAFALMLVLLIGFMIYGMIYFRRVRSESIDELKAHREERKEWKQDMLESNRSIERALDRLSSAIAHSTSPGTRITLNGETQQDIEVNQNNG